MERRKYILTGLIALALTFFSLAALFGTKRMEHYKKHKFEHCQHADEHGLDEQQSE